MGVLLGIFFSSLGISLSGAIMPGPLLSVAVAESYKKGFWAGPVLAAGHAIPELVLAVLFTLGLNKFLNNKIAEGIIGVVGGIFLAWLAVRLFLDVKRGVILDLSKKEDVGWGPLVAGLWASVSNPGWIIWWATIGARYILLSLQHGIVGLAFFYIGHVSADFLWYSLVSFMVSRGRGRISDRVYHIVLLLSAVMVAGFAIFFIVNGTITLVRSS